MIISLLFVTPFMVSDEIYNGVIMAKEFWFFGVVALMLLYSAIQMLIKKDKLRIEFNLVDILLLAFYTWCFIRAIFTPYTPFYYNHKLQILTGMMIVYFFVKNAIRNENYEGKNYSFIPSFIHSLIPKPFIISFLIFSFILSGFLQAIYGLLQLYGIYPSYNSYFKITGSFFNPAPYAMYLAVVFPVALGQMLMKNERIKNEGIKKYSFIFSFLNSFTQKYLPIATVIAIILVLPATMNRASWLGALAGSLVVLQYKYSWLQQIKNWLNTRTKKIMGITFSVLLVCGIGLSLFYMKAGSSNGRMFIWEVTLGKIAEKPLFGHGLGRFEAEYNNWQAEYFMKHPEDTNSMRFADNTRYSFNEYFEILVETGIPGLLLLLIVIITTFLLVRSKSANISILAFSLLSVVVCAAISFPFYSLPTFFVFFALLALISSSRGTEIKK
ncbi:MAG TPA: O-antigen ligase family protein, partial [Bacteroidales bacterium]|nr:O-antigen ligase family protein [Bacteroidales bacterium]